MILVGFQHIFDQNSMDQFVCVLLPNSKNFWNHFHNNSFSNILIYKHCSCWGNVETSFIGCFDFPNSSFVIQIKPRSFVHSDLFIQTSFNLNSRFFVYISQTSGKTDIVSNHNAGIQWLEVHHDQGIIVQIRIRLHDQRNAGSRRLKSELQSKRSKIKTCDSVAFRQIMLKSSELLIRKRMFSILYCDPLVSSSVKSMPWIVELSISLLKMCVW